MLTARTRECIWFFLLIPPPYVPCLSACAKGQAFIEVLVLLLKVLGGEKGVSDCHREGIFIQCFRINNRKSRVWGNVKGLGLRSSLVLLGTPQKRKWGSEHELYKLAGKTGNRTSYLYYYMACLSPFPNGFCSYELHIMIFFCSPRVTEGGYHSEKSKDEF